MKLQIHCTTEAEVDRVADLLDRAGLEYFVDYEALYGDAWAMTGIQLSTARAAYVAAGLFPVLCQKEVVL